MATTARDPILVVGGGLGGAAVALALALNGFRVRLIEQAPEFGVIGYGIQLGPNSFHMFDRLGLSEAVLKQSIIPNSLLMLASVDGAIIARIPTRASFVERFKHPYIVIHRVDLHHILLDACKANSDIELMPETNVIGYEDLGDRVRLRTQGDDIEGAAIVGADGLRSTIRQQMVGEGEPRMIGFVAHRTIVPMSEVSADVRRNDVVLWSGPGFHIVHYPLRAGTLFNIVAVFKTSSYFVAGLGIALLPEQYVAAELTSGTLLRVLPQHEVRRPVTALYARSPHIPQKVRLLVSFLVQWFKNERARSYA